MQWGWDKVWAETGVSVPKYWGSAGSLRALLLGAGSVLLCLAAVSPWTCSPPSVLPRDSSAWGRHCILTWPCFCPSLDFLQNLLHRLGWGLLVSGSRDEGKGSPFHLHNFEMLIKPPP